MPNVTIVLSTYNRPACLRAAIESVRRQTYPDWLLLVIGDKAGPDTRAAVESFDDERIVFLNLETRCGEQGGPNTVGMSVAETPYVALLNHDDIWLPDHLRVSIDRMEAEHLELYVGAAVFTGFVMTDQNTMGCTIQRFNPERRDFRQAFYRNTDYLEPSSAWVMRRELIDKVGGWRPAATLYRPPMVDWMLRAWQAETRAEFSDILAVIKCNADKLAWYADPGSTKRLYELNCEEQWGWLDFLNRRGVAELMRLVAETRERRSQAVPAPETAIGKEPTVDFQYIMEALVNEKTAMIYKAMGWDAYEHAFVLSGHPKGAFFHRLLKNRTGETLPSHDSWESQIAFARRALVRDPKWRKHVHQS